MYLKAIKFHFILSSISMFYTQVTSVYFLVKCPAAKLRSKTGTNREMATMQHIAKKYNITVCIFIKRKIEISYLNSHVGIQSYCQHQSFLFRKQNFKISIKITLELKIPIGPPCGTWQVISLSLSLSLSLSFCSFAVIIFVTRLLPKLFSVEIFFLLTRFKSI